MMFVQPWSTVSGAEPSTIVVGPGEELIALHGSENTVLSGTGMSHSKPESCSDVCRKAYIDIRVIWVVCVYIYTL